MEELLGRTVDINKQDGQISIDWIPVTRVVAPRRDGISLEWYEPGMRQASIGEEEKRAIAGRFSAATGVVPRELWTV